MFRPNHCRAREPAADLKALHGGTGTAIRNQVRLPHCCWHDFSASDLNLHTLVAGRDSMAFASSASSLSKTGVPSPLGQFRTMQVTSPPHESPRTRTSLMAAGHTDSTGQKGGAP